MRLIILILIVLTGLLLRLDNAWDGSERNMPDSAAYERIARGLHEEGRFSQTGPGTPAHPQPATNYSPGLPLLVAGWYGLTGGEDVRSARILLALISALSIPLAWTLALRLTPAEAGTAAAVSGAAVAAFYPTVISDTGMLLTEPLAGTLIAGSLLALLAARDSGKAAVWILAGVLLGLTAMVRPEYLTISVLAGAAVVATLPARTFRARALPACLLGLAFLLTVAPWSVHTARETGRLVPLSTGGGQTLFTGSIISSNGDPQKVMPGLLDENPDIAARIEHQNRVSGEGSESITPERVFTLLAADRHPGVPTDLALARMGRENYIDGLTSDPVGLGGLIVAKSTRVWWRGRSDLTGSPGGQIFHWLITGFAVTGLVLLAARRRPEVWIILALTAGATAIGAVLVASPRRSLVLWPVVAALSGVGVGGAIELAKAGLTRRTRPLPVA
ncbi:MAG: glycosyltransferase family 39 protein [Actinomycetota bacterium]|nr:glycosyltransferase family 39 protein [Actinomycetota bacterium]